MVISISNQVGNRYNIQSEELWGEGYFALLDSKRTYRNRRGTLEKHLSLGIRYRLRNSAKQIKKEVSNNHIEGIKIYAPEELTPFEYLSELNLSRDAIEIIRIIQNIPERLRKQLEKNKKTPKAVFEEYLRKERKWKHTRVWKSFHELRSKIKRG